MNKTINLKTLQQHVIKERLDLYDTIIADCDGVLWHDNEALPQVPETINMLKSLGKKCTLLQIMAQKPVKKFGLKQKK